MGNVVWWSIVLVGLLLAGFIAVAQVKKRLVRTDDISGGSGFTLSDLRALHRAGKMSDEEFEKAKQVILGAMKRAADRQAGAATLKQPPIEGAPGKPGDPPVV